MKLSLFSYKLWLVVTVGAFLVVAQYKIVNSWLVSPRPLQPLVSPWPLQPLVSPRPLQPLVSPRPLQPLVSPRPLQPLVQSGNTQRPAASDVNQLQVDGSIVATVGERGIQDIAQQVHKQLSTKIFRTTVNRASKSLFNSKKPIPSPKKLPPLYIVTPTYPRPEQIPELTRLSQTLMHVPNMHWLVIEDSKHKTLQVTRLLERSGLSFDHLIAPMPDRYKNRRGSKPRGVSNRNRALEWLRANASTGVFYFADDDNSYDLALFQEMRYTKRVSMWPVALCTNEYGLSTPIVRDGTIAGFYSGWYGGRKFRVDMAGFAVSVKFLLQRPKAIMPYKPGYEEDGFLRSLAPFELKDIELKADNCTKILVWHTQTRKNEPAIKPDRKKYKNTNLIQLRSLLV